MKHYQRLTLFFMIVVLAACGNAAKKSSTSETAPQLTGPAFQADSAYSFCEQQCQFGPRTMNSEAHDRCGQWIVAKFRSYGMEVVEQKATLKGYDGTPLKATNIIACHHPERADRVLLCAHWDSRPWADNDPDEANWRQPVMAANDGASGVAVMLEIARLLNQADSLRVGVDFICFDAEDWGVPQWTDEHDSDSWALGAQYWSAHKHRDDYQPRFGILFDMVGGQGARFFREAYSLRYARNVVDRVWQAAQVVGVSTYFPQQENGLITDDHVPVNEVAGIPCIDIIPCYPDCEASSFGPTWHTVADDMAHIDRATLGAVGQTIIQVLYSE